ncbi:MAG: hypothetical protein JOZ36_17540, partial [Acidobacteria bacterium]|nr:hypothetical protein [Acidobacteriota bacterium]
MCTHTNMRCWATIALLSCAALTGCGGGSSVVGQGPGLGNSSNNALLQGQYAFALSGQDSNGLFLMVGTFAADGNGHLAGSEDVNSSSLTSRGSGVPFSGTYAIGSDGRGNAVLGIQPGCPNWQFTMLNHSHGLLTCLNTNITGSGTIDLADPRAFSISALKGNYVFGFSGLGASAGFAVTAGSWSMDGGGTVNAGIADVNDAGTVSQALSLSGSYSVASTGRGTATISSHYATQNFVFYIVNATDIKFMESDSTAGVPRVSGEVLNQAPVFTTSSLSGIYPFTLGGIDANQSALALGGLLPADGNGNISSGVMDVNDAGNITLGVSLTGTYSVGASGRGVATLSSPVFLFPIAFYAAAN